jgi:hypothetical protein
MMHTVQSYVYDFIYAVAYIPSVFDDDDGSRLLVLSSEYAVVLAPEVVAAETCADDVDTCKVQSRNRTASIHLLMRLLTDDSMRTPAPPLDKGRVCTCALAISRTMSRLTTIYIVIYNCRMYIVVKE